MTALTDNIPLIGRLACEQGLLSAEQVAQCIALQEQTELRLGDLFVLQMIQSAATHGGSETFEDDMAILLFRYGN